MTQIEQIRNLAILHGQVLDALRCEWQRADERCWEFAALGGETGGYEKLAADERALVRKLLASGFDHAFMPLLPHLPPDLEVAFRDHWSHLGELSKDCRGFWKSDWTSTQADLVLRVSAHCEREAERVRVELMKESLEKHLPPRPPIVEQFLKKLNDVLAEMGTIMLGVQKMRDWFEGHPDAEHHVLGYMLDSKVFAPRRRERWFEEHDRIMPAHDRWVPALTQLLTAAGPVWAFLKRNADIEPGWTSKQHARLVNAHGLIVLCLRCPWTLPVDDWAGALFPLQNLRDELQTMPLEMPHDPDSEAGAQSSPTQADLGASDQRENDAIRLSALEEKVWNALAERCLKAEQLEPIVDTSPEYVRVAVGSIRRKLGHRAIVTKSAGGYYRPNVTRNMQSGARKGRHRASRE